jgi:Tfp pilus assembly protein FimT
LSAPRRGARAPRRAGAFTLLELIAVTLLIGLVAGLALPNFAALGEQGLRDQARELAGDLELARERALVTGVRHRLVLDLEGGSWWTEREAPPEAEAETVVAAGGVRVALSPPHAARSESEWTPAPDRSGREHLLAEDVSFDGVELETTILERGVLALPFEVDGTAPRASIWLARPDGRALAVELEPLGDTVRIADEREG